MSPSVAEEIASGLSADERTVMTELARIPKSDRGNVFFVEDLRRRKRCAGIDLDTTLQSLADQGLVRRAGSERWATTKPGRWVEHYLWNRRFRELNPGITHRE